MDPIRQAKMDIVKTMGRLAMFAFKNFDPSAEISPANAFVMMSMGQTARYMKTTMSIISGVAPPENRRCMFY